MASTINGNVRSLLIMELLAQNADCTLILNKKAQVCWTSNTVLPLLGYVRTELLGKLFYDLLHIDDLSKFSGEINTLNKNLPDKVELECRLQRKDHNYVWTKMTLLNFLHHEVFNGIAICLDNLESQQMMSDFYSHQRMLTEIVQKESNTGSWEFNFATQQLTKSKNFHRLLELPEDFTLPPDLKAVYKGTSLNIYHFLRHYLFAPKEEIFELQFLSAKGTVKYISVSTKLLKDKFGEPTGLVGVLHDITDEKQAENYLKETNQEAKIGGWTWDIAQNKLHWTSQMCDIFDAPTNYKTSPGLKTEMECFQAHDLRRLKETIMGLYEHGNACTLELPIRTFSNNYRWINITAKAVVISGQVRFIRGTIQDVTNQKSMEDDMIKLSEGFAKANDELDLFVYHTSHNLRAPLSSVLGLVNLLRQTKDPQEQEQYLTMMEKSIHRLDNTIHEITDYSKNTHVDIKTNEVAFADIIQTIINQFSFLEELNKVNIMTDIQPRLHFVSDANRIQVILANTFLNAIKYYDTKKVQPYVKINIYESEDEKGIYIEVKDNGIGIDSDQLDRVFDMFYRASPRSNGSGLGLYIVQEAAKKLRGTVSLKSIPGVGTTLNIYLPNLAV